MTKTPEYTRKAVKAYDVKVKKKQVVLNPEQDDEMALLHAIDSDEMSFSERCKQLLKKHYGIE